MAKPESRMADELYPDDYRISQKDSDDIFMTDKKKNITNQEDMKRPLEYLDVQ